MKLFKTHRKLAMAALAFTVAIVAGGVAAAYWTSSGGGTGAAQTGSTTPLLIDQLGGTPMYNSTVDANAYNYSQCYYCVQMGDFGNKINLAGGGGPLSDVLVSMVNFNDLSAQTPPYTMDMTLNIYNPGTYIGPGSAPGTLIAKDSQAFTIPSAPSGGYYGSTCTADRVTNPNSLCGLAFFNVVFNFESQNVTLPGTVVYDIQYNDPQNNVDGGVNVQLANEDTQITVGSDTAPGYLFASLASTANNNGYDNSYNNVGPGEVTCDTVTTTFGEYPTASCEGGAEGYGLPPYVPAVEFDMNTMADLYPGGPAQPVSFMVTNPGNIPETVNSVAITVTGTSDNLDCNTTNFAMLNGSDVSGTDPTSTYTAGFPTVIPAGGTVVFTSATTDAQIYMINLDVNQDGCQSLTVDLGFTSS